MTDDHGVIRIPITLKALKQALTQQGYAVCPSNRLAGLQPGSAAAGCATENNIAYLWAKIKTL